MRRNPDCSFSLLILLYGFDYVNSLSSRRCQLAMHDGDGRNESGLLATRYGEDRVHGAPAVPRGDRSKRPERIPFGLEGAWRRQILQLVRERPALADSIVVHRPHVEPAQLKDQEHLGGPPADASHLDEVRDQLVV